MKSLLEDHMIWLVISLALILIVVLVLQLTNHAIDERLITGGVLVLIGAIANHAREKKD